jgi:DNA-directed RNA polymerase sigma subunit (sigma70/sigma32)
VRDNRFMGTFVWPADDGWPYPDTAEESVDLDSEFDDDLLSLRVPPPHFLDDLDPLEREVITARFGLEGAAVRSMKELHAQLGVPRNQLRIAMGSGLAKLREHLSG